MSKSLGNFFTVREAADAYGYGTIRMFMLMSHYRSPLNYSGEILMQARAALERLTTARENLVFLTGSGADGEMTAEEKAAFDGLGKYREKFIAAMDDDFNTADGMSAIFEMVRDINSAVAGTPTKALAKACLSIFDELTGVMGVPYKPEKAEDDGVVTLGSKVRVYDVDEDCEEEYQIVGSQEANPMAGRISGDSPFGRGLLRHKVGDTVSVEAPMGVLHFRILNIET